MTLVALIGGFVLLFPAEGLRALGLGEARVDSYLGQPLDVSIRLLDVDSDAVEALTVVSASPSDYERIGLPSEALALGLDVSIDRSAEPPTIQLRSQRPVNDPVVQVLLDARFASGRILREYTLFLDPPTIDSPAPIRRVDEVDPAEETPAEPADERVVERDEPEPAPPPAERPEPAPEPAEPEAEPEPAPAPEPAAAPAADDTVTVASGDTLWSIAFNWRPEPGLSMDQVLLAIYERNRHAFMDENINRLRSGAELTMPELDDVRAVGRQEAEQRVREHMQAWQHAAPTEDVPEVADAAVPEVEEPAEPAPTPAEEVEETAHRLDVVPPEDDAFAEGAAVSDGEVERVSGALDELEDEIVTEGLEAERFEDHVAEIREALDTRDMAGLAFAEESLAELEARLREARREREEDEEPAPSRRDAVDAYFQGLERELVDVDEEPAPVPDEAPETEPELAERDTELAPVEETEEPVAEPEPEPVADVAEPAVAETEPATGRDALPLTWIALSAALFLAMVAAVVLLVLRRRRLAAEGAGMSAAEPVDDAEVLARKALAANPANLANHLALLKVLGAEEDSERFADALDQMYQHVDDEDDEHWREALELASVHAPDHPMLTPPEEPVTMDEPDEVDDADRPESQRYGQQDDQPAGDEEEEDELLRRTDEMLSMFDSDDDLEDEDEASDRQSVGAADESSAADNDEARRERELGENLDLGELANRLDEPEPFAAADEPADDDDDLEFSRYSEDDDTFDTIDESEQPAEVEDSGTDTASADVDDFSLDFDDDEEEPATTDSQAGDEDALELSVPDVLPEEPADNEPDTQETSQAADQGFDFILDTDRSEDEAADDADEDDHVLEGVDAGLSLDFDPGDAVRGDEESDDSLSDSVADAEAGDAGDGMEDLSLDFEGDLSDDRSETPDDVETGVEEEIEDDDQSLDADPFSLEQEEAGRPDGDRSELSSEALDAGEEELGDEDAEVKLDLARAYMSVDLAESARTILEEVVAGASPEKQAEARKLLDEL
ncbi:hypothetical protein IC757_05380 [Wenzhouxiangella sp. AB-CW3]|uniref:FimV/HubP family polar landmark protein n=1 Tax=Wenzhouxiangella sp. AB-CW3 TaxID=2771012 RepID=UPI00168BF1C5|nr:FimV/HubP family polar landmark protein [Wenzhouxiangella sp. AB-CW3]QOC23571.1 hypothetical protein IC757_05380 [Wenzhouxiangella sp. AB-CW3]